HNHIYAWGDPEAELRPFSTFHLFNNDIRFIPHNVQDKFTDWYGSCNSNDKYSLQFAIKTVFNEYLNKQMTLAEWACGIDLNLDTFIPKQFVGQQRTLCIQEEKRIRSLLKEYAMNDCFAVTKLIHRIMPIEQNSLTPQPLEYEQVSDDELTVVHVRDELPLPMEDISTDNEEQQPLVHVEYEPRTPLAHQLFTGELSIHVEEPLTPLFSHSPPHRHSSSSTTRVLESSSSHSSSHRTSSTTTRTIHIEPSSNRPSSTSTTR
ncbi:unnamed protein product, partial [Didymodactylos carnosus]